MKLKIKLGQLDSAWFPNLDQNINQEISDESRNSIYYRDTTYLFFDCRVCLQTNVEHLR